MNEPLMSPPTAFKSPIVAESTPSQQPQTTMSRSSDDMEIEDKNSKGPETIASSPMMMPPPSVTKAAPISETKQSPEALNSPRVGASPESTSINNTPPGNVGDEVKNNVDRDQIIQTKEKEKQQDGKKGIESNAEAAASALLMIRH